MDRRSAERIVARQVRFAFVEPIRVGGPDPAPPKLSSVPRRRGP